MVDVGGGLMFPDFSVSYVDLDLFNVSFIDFICTFISPLLSSLFI